MDRGSSIVYIKTEDIYKDIVEDVKTRFDYSNYELSSSLQKGKDKKVIQLMKDELGWKIMSEFMGLRAKTCSYLIHNSSEDKKAKDTKKCAIERKPKFETIKIFRSNSTWK